MKADLHVNLLPFGAARAPHIDLGAASGIAPVDPPRGHASGPAPYRVLVVGGRAAAGRGVLTHDLSLAGALARSLARRLGHGIDVDVDLVDVLDLDTAEDVVWGARLQPVDALILIPEPDRATKAADDLLGRMRRLLVDAASRLPETSALTVAVAPPFRPASLSGRAYAGFVDAVRRAAIPAAAFLELSAPDPAPAPSELYAAWAEEIAEATTAAMRDPFLWTDDVDVVDERHRAKAAKGLGPFDERWEAAFRRVVSFASAAYGTKSAAFSIIDDEITRRPVRCGYETAWSPREETICDRVLRTYGGIIIGDAREDERFADLPGVRNGSVAFYAGYRIMDPSGMPVAALCVSDPEPRSVLTQDIALLRDFALTAERRLWALMRERSSVPHGVATA